MSSTVSSITGNPILLKPVLRKMTTLLLSGLLCQIQFESLHKTFQVSINLSQSQVASAISKMIDLPVEDVLELFEGEVSFTKKLNSPCKFCQKKLSKSEERLVNASITTLLREFKLYDDSCPSDDRKYDRVARSSAVGC